MAEAREPCCEREFQTQLKLIGATYTTFPVIKDVPCPTCQRIIPIRVYKKPETTPS